MSVALAAATPACSSGGSAPPVAAGHDASPASLHREGTLSTTSAVPASTSETPLAADALAEFVGINTHVSTMYLNSDFPKVVSLVKNLGVRHVRDAIISNEPDYASAVGQLLGSTAKLDGLTDCAGIAYNANSATSAAQIQAFDGAIGSKMEAVEGPNEVDERNDATWVTDTVSCLPSLKNALPSLPFLAPSLADPNDDASTLGNISSLVDFGNVHRYFSGHNPGSPGWGDTFSCGTYGSLTWAMCLAGVNAGSKADIVTETGYNSQTEVDEATQAKYLSRAFLVNLKAGISHSFAYVLRDYTGDEFGGDGLVRSDDSLKPAYTALQNEIAYFNDPGSNNVGSALTYSLSNANLDHLLFRRRDGSYVLALWNETASWNPSAQTEISVPAQQQTVTLQTPPKSISAATLTDTGAPKSVTATVTATSVTLPVDDHVSVLQFSL